MRPPTSLVTESVDINQDLDTEDEGDDDFDGGSTSRTKDTQPMANYAATEEFLPYFW